MNQESFALDPRHRRIINVDWIPPLVTTQDFWG